MSDQTDNKALFRFENKMILQLHKIAEGNRRITRTLAVGYMDSDITAAIVELKSAANYLEAAREEYLASQLRGEKQP